MQYLFLSAIYAAILYAVYKLFLRDRASHAWNRFYLLLSATLPFLLPFFYLPGINYSIPYNIIGAKSLLPEVVIFSKKAAETGIGAYTLNELFTTIYLSGITILLLYFSVQYFSFRRFVAGKPYELLPDSVKVITDCGYGPGSFGRYIFFPGKTTDPAILQHELAHVRHGHTRDIIYLKLLQCLFWPNPVLYVIIKELQVVHEFEADSSSATNKEAYIESMLNTLLGNRSFSISHTFFHHPIKRRIVMLQKTPQSRNTLRTATIRSGITATVLIAGIVYLQSCNRQPATEKDIAKPMQTTMVAPENQDTQALNHVDHMPESSVDISEFLGKNIIYPQEAKKKGIEGKVLVKFIVDENGDLKSPAIVRSPDQSLSDEAIRVIMSMPKWKPGTHEGKNVRVYFTIPISFKLS